jgi:hypothetical protein
MGIGVRHSVHAILVGVVVAATSACGDAGKPVPLTEEEKAKLIAAETEDQKKLREDLAGLAAKGQKIYFMSNKGTGARVYRMAPDGSGVTCLTPDLPFADKPHASPDGTRVVINMTAPYEEVKKLPRSDALKRRIKSDKDKMARCLGILDPETKKAVPVVIGDNGHWSPDGKKICYNTCDRPRKIGIFDLEKKEETIITKVPKTAMFPNFTPNGKFVIIGGYPFTFATLNADGSAKVGKLAIGSGCNNEVSRDGTRLVWVIDTYGGAAGWLCSATFDQETGTPGKGEKLPLGWDKKSVNYYPDFSPCGTYLVYAHGEPVKGRKSYQMRPDLELYVTRFPKCDVTVRITWSRAAHFHSTWWGPPAEEKKR